MILVINHKNLLAYQINFNQFFFVFTYKAPRTFVSRSSWLL